MRTLALSLPLCLALGCGFTGDPEDPEPATADAGTDEAAACCTPNSLRDLPADRFVSAAEVPTFAVDEETEAEPLPAPALPENSKFTALTKAGHLQIQSHPETGKPWRLWLKSKVCARNVPLEVFVCKAGTKEHEAILAADIDGRAVHTALVAMNAKPGAPARWEPKYVPATGAKIKVSVFFLPKKDGEAVMLPAQEWILDMTTQKPMKADWVFAGSRFIKDPFEPDLPEYYAANNGELISLSNFVDSMLDIPVQSPDDNSSLLYRGYEERVPPLGSDVWVVLEPVAEG